MKRYATASVSTKGFGTCHEVSTAMSLLTVTPFKNRSAAPASGTALRSTKNTTTNAPATPQLGTSRMPWHTAFTPAVHASRRSDWRRHPMTASPTAMATPAAALAAGRFRQKPHAAASTTCSKTTRGSNGRATALATG